MTNTALKIEINTLPKNLRQEVADFVPFLKSKSKVNTQLKEREFGYFRDKIKFATNFDGPLNEFKNYM